MYPVTKCLKRPFAEAVGLDPRPRRSAAALGQLDQGSQIGRIDDNRFKVGRVCQVVLKLLKGFAGQETKLAPTGQPPEGQRGCDSQEITEGADGVRVGF